MKLLAFSLALLAMVIPSPAAEAGSLYQIPLKDIDGRATTLQEHAGKVMLLVNVASKCGYTSQYQGLEALWRKYKEQGVVVLGFPSNDFGSQEPGTNAEIKEFCTSRFEVSFPMYEKIHVKGSEQHPLYAALTGPSSPVPGAVKWNFGKFLVGRDGTILGRFGSGTEPESKELTEAIDAAVAKK